MKVFRCQQKLPRSRRSKVHKKIKMSWSICCILEMFDSFIDVTTPIVCTSKRTGFHTSRIFKHIHFIIRSIMKNIILITQKRKFSPRSVFRYQNSNPGRASLFDQFGEDTMIQWYRSRYAAWRWERAPAFSWLDMPWHIPVVARLNCHHPHSVPDTSRVTSVIFRSVLIISVLSNIGPRQLRVIIQNQLCQVKVRCWKGSWPPRSLKSWLA